MTIAPQDPDVSSPEAVVAAAYALISGRASEPRDWRRFRSLHAPGARIIRVGPPDSDATVEIFDVDSYERSRTPMLAAGDFYEQETDRRVERFQDVAHVWSVYEARRAPGAEPFLRGVNSVQLVRREDRWTILTVFWQHAPFEAP